MAHWFHRNPLKATAPQTFELRAAATTSNSQKICTELRHARVQLLDLISNPNNEIMTMNQAAEKYFSLLPGFVTAMDDKGGDSKLRYALKFRWTNTLLGGAPTEVQDIVFEICSMLMNIALWFTKHAARLASQDEPNMDEAKEVHKCLRKAAGIFSYVKEEWVTKLLEVPDKNTDLDSRILAAYIHQCTAEAQEITIARAIELKHKATIVSALAYETAKLYTDADDSLNSLDEKVVNKWRKYLQFKTKIYYAYAYDYHGETILAEDKCGEAIRCLQESKTNYEQSLVLGKEYSSQKGPGTTCKPHEHLFFRKLGPIVDRTLEKCVRENGFIYHQKVPPEAPALQLQATYGLVAPEEFKIPDPNPLWTPETYSSFNISLTPKPDPKEQKKEEEQKDLPLPPVKEADIPASNKDPNTFSGCIVS